MTIINYIVNLIIILEISFTLFISIKYIIKKLLFERKKLMPYSLVIVDMQEEFKASLDKNTILNCIEAINNAKKDNATIIFLEFVGSGRTHYSLFKEVQFYEQTFFLRKTGCDGSLEVELLSKGIKIPNLHFKVCGVNTDVCVQYTAIGLQSTFPSAVIEVLSKACNSEIDHEYGLSVMEMYENIFINTKSC